jgi:hypothetical protein
MFLGSISKFNATLTCQKLFFYPSPKDFVRRSNDGEFILQQTLPDGPRPDKIPFPFYNVANLTQSYSRLLFFCNLFIFPLAFSLLGNSERRRTSLSLLSRQNTSWIGNLFPRIGVLQPLVKVER